MSTGARSTVVVITHDRRDELLRTLEHMTALPERAPVIVVDNASGDGSAEAVRARFPEVTVLVEPVNAGAVARNHAVRCATTPYVTFCDDDVRWQPGAIRTAVDLLDRHPDIGAVMGRCLVEPDLVEDPLTPELRDSPVPAPPWLPGTALLSVMAGLTTVRVSAFRAAGGFSERLWLGGEEELLAIDLVRAGWWLCWAEEVVVHHRPSGRRDSRGRRRLGIRNTLLTTWARRPLGAALRRSASVLAGCPKDRHTVAAVGGVLRALPWLLRERRCVPPELEAQLRLLEEPQRTSVARRYVG
ncbi:glycosyltransferase [Saccharopolyspora gregorii]|uniref:glycosyltransferase n=1 Tax=Saccharopolyspora gregorii TaxID=33914 RepID=UPI0021AD3173|nr:glycosyltransferase [Saccharopolyspora gregorii]